MAAKKTKKYLIEVETNPTFCGIDAGGVQFAHGQAVIGEGTMVNWFLEHDGYKVTEITDASGQADATTDAKTDTAK